MFFVVAFLLAAFLFVFIAREYRNHRAGLPSKDEREHALNGRAGNYAFLVSVYWVLALMYYSNLETPWFGAFPDTAAALGASIVGMAALYGCSQLFVRTVARI